MKQYRITTENLSQDSPDDAYLAPDDPIHELKISNLLGELGAEERLNQYRLKNVKHDQEINKSVNIGLSGSEKRRLEQEHNINPGTPEWFKLWFSKSSESPLGK